MTSAYSNLNYSNGIEASNNNQTTMKFAGSICQTYRLFALGLAVFGASSMSIVVSPLFEKMVQRNRILINSGWRFHLSDPGDIISDGSTLTPGSLPAAARQELEVAFAPKTAHWLKFIVAGMKVSAQNIDLAEI